MIIYCSVCDYKQEIIVSKIWRITIQCECSLNSLSLTAAFLSSLEDRLKSQTQTHIWLIDRLYAKLEETNNIPTLEELLIPE